MLPKPVIHDTLGGLRTLFSVVALAAAAAAVIGSSTGTGIVDQHENNTAGVITMLGLLWH